MWIDIQTFMEASRLQNKKPFGYGPATPSWSQLVSHKKIKINPNHVLCTGGKIMRLVPGALTKTLTLCAPIRLWSVQIMVTYWVQVYKHTPAENSANKTWAYSRAEITTDITKYCTYKHSKRTTAAAMTVVPESSCFICDLWGLQHITCEALCELLI